MTDLSKLSIAELQAEPWQGTPWRSIPSANILFAGSTAPVTWSIIADGPVLIASQLEKEVAAYIVALQNRHLEAASGKDSLSFQAKCASQETRSTTCPEQPDPDGWIAWAGGECPVDGATVIDAKFARGNIAHGARAYNLFWWHDNHSNQGSNLVAYRLTPAAKAP